jgi:hypothetical protein
VGPFSGLGRLSLESFGSADNLAPAYATDLMADVDGAVLDVTTFDGRRIFAISGEGFYAESGDGTKVGFGTVRSGWIDYRLPDDKVAMYLTVHHQSEDGGSHRVALAVDGGDEVELNTVSTSDARFLAGEARGKSFEWTLSLFRDGAESDVAPTVQAVVLESEPTTRTVEFITVPLLLAESLTIQDGIAPCFPALEREFVEGLRRDRRLVTYQEAGRRWSVVVADFKWQPHQFSQEGPQRDVNGTLLTKLKVVN